MCFKGGGMGMQDEKEGEGGEIPTTADGFRFLAFSHSRFILVLRDVGMEWRYDTSN